MGSGLSKLPPGVLDTMKRMYAQGVGRKRIGERFGISEPRVRRHLAAAGVELRGHVGGRKKPIPIHKIVEAYDLDGDSIQTIADRHGVAWNTIRRRLRDANVKVRQRVVHHNGLGSRLAQLVLILETKGGVDAIFTFAEVRRVLGKAITARLRHMEWEMRSRRTLERVGWGQYRLLPEWQARAQEWIDSGDALKFRQMRARQIQKQIDADEKVIKKRQGPSPWAQVNRQYRERRKARRTQTGRVIQALRAAGGPLKWEDVAKAAGPNGWSKANRKKAIEGGQVVYDRLTRLYDLPTRDTAPSMAQDREEFLLLALAAGGAMSLAEMGDALGVDRRVIKDAPLKRCRKRGEIERTGPGRYELTDKGMEAVKAIVARNVEGET